MSDSHRHLHHHPPAFPPLMWGVAGIVVVGLFVLVLGMLH